MPMLQSFSIRELILTVANGGLVENVPPQGRAYFPSLDGLRAFSFLGVFFWHYLNLPYGWAGVDIFFVLSGFLITGILYDTRDDLHRVRNFYIRRTLRIFPLYYGVLLAILLLTPLFHWTWTWQWIAWPLYLGNFLRFLYPHLDNSFVRSFTNAALFSCSHPRIILRLGHFWTLCVEEQFYLLWPWIVFTVRDRRKLMVICAVCVFLVPVARTIATAHMPAALVSGGIVFHATPFRFDTLLLGALVALLYRGSHRRQMQHAAQVILVLAILCVLSICAYWFRFHDARLNDAVTHHPWMLSVVALFGAALMLRTLIPGTVAYRIFNLRWLRLVGTVSYGAYLFHEILHNEYDRLAAHYFTRYVDITSAVLALAMTLVLSFLSYRFFEYPLLRLKSRFTSSHANPSRRIHARA